jgi:hypothetical protein
MDDETPITVDMIRPYLTDRGRIEIDFAVQTLRVRMLTQDNIELRERLSNGQVSYAKTAD